MPSRAYLLSLPERVIRSALGLSAGLLREIGEVALPRTVRRGQLYKSLVDTTLRYLIEQVGGAKGVYSSAAPHAQDFLARRGVGHGIELLGIAAFRVSPVWVFAALADLSGLGLRVIPEIAEALKEQGLVEKEARSETVDQLLDSLEKTSSRLAQTINVPPIDVPSLRKEWAEIRLQARGLKPPDLQRHQQPMGGAEGRGGATGPLDIRDLIRDGDLRRTLAARARALALRLNTRGCGAHRKTLRGGDPRGLQSHP